MEQNNFEKNVQQKLDELKIPPSDLVWVNVEKRIGKKEKGRKLIFIFSFLILCLLSGGYWLLNSSKNSGQERQLSEVKKDSKPTNNENSFLEENESVKNHLAKTPYSTTVSKDNIKPASIKFQNKISAANQKAAVSKTETRERTQVLFLSKNKNPNKKNEKKLSIGTDSKPTAGNEIIDKGNIATTDSFLDKKEISKDSAENNIQAIAKKEPKKSTEKIRDYWKIGITFSGGTSMIHGSSSSGNSSFVTSDPVSYNGGTPSYYAPSEIRNSFGFVAGIFAEKNISPKKKISIGISYKYFSLLNKVEPRINSSYSLPQFFTFLNNANSTFNLKTYRNNFHFIEVPASIKFQLNNNSGLPIFWDAAINISELIGTNALQFNPNGGLYYSDNSFFNKTQFGLSTGFSATLFSKGKIPFNIGPYFYYSATNIAGKGLYSKRHFTFIGVKSEILFGKK